MEDARPSLRHLAIVADGIGSPPSPAAIAAAFATAAALAPAAVAAAPALAAVTFFSPEIRDRVLSADAPARRACADGLATLAASARGAGARFRVLGRSDRLPGELRPAAGGDPAGRALVGWFLDYGARDEILRAAGRIPKGASVDEEGFAALLDTAGLPDPDLVVYAGGAFEPKDFLLWQASYAELWHTPARWADFTAESLRVALADFSRRQRRFGG